MDLKTKEVKQDQIGLDRSLILDSDSGSQGVKGKAPMVLRGLV